MNLESIFKKAAETRTMSPGDWATIQRIGTLEPTTTFRKGLFRGEHRLIFYEYINDDGEIRKGWMGFNEAGTLVSIDERQRGTVMQGVRYLLIEECWHFADSPEARWRPLDEKTHPEGCSCQTWDKPIDLIAIFEKALATRTISPADWDDIRASNRLEPSTSLRMNLFVGEQSMLYFSFEDHGRRRIGFLGFNEHGTLVSIDEHPSSGGIKYLLINHVWHSAKIGDIYRAPNLIPAWKPVRD